MNTPRSRRNLKRVHDREPLLDGLLCTSPVLLCLVAEEARDVPPAVVLRQVIGEDVMPDPPALAVASGTPSLPAWPTRWRTS
jgi:hypothetical protein